MGRGTVESKHEIISLLRNFMITVQYVKPVRWGAMHRKSGRATTRDAVGR